MAHEPSINAATSPETSRDAAATAHTDKETVTKPGEEGGKDGSPPGDSATPQSDDISDEKPRDIPPDGGYGWVCVACAAFINAHTWGVNSSYGVFLSYYLSNNIFPGMTPISYALTGGLSMSCCLLISPLVTHLIHLYGNRIVLNCGVCLQTISFIGASFATQNWHLFLSQGVCFGFGMGLIFIASVSIIPQWFERRRSLASSICAGGSGFGGLAYSLGTGAMIPRLGLPWTFRILGILSFTVNLIASNLMRNRNKAVGSRYRAFHFPLLKRPEFLVLLCWGILSLMGYVVLLFSLPNYALSVGLTAHQGSIAGALLNLGQGVGRPLVGLISDRYGRITMSTYFSFAAGILCIALWIPAMNMGLLCFFAIVVGTVAGTFWTTSVPITAEVLGMQDLPSGLSIIWLVMVVPTTVAEPIGVVLKDDSKSKWIYLYSQIFTGLTYIVGAAFLWVVRGWKVGDNERIARDAAIADAARAARSAQANASNNVLSVPTSEKTNEAPIAEPEPPSAQTIGPEISPWSSQHLLRRMTKPNRV